MWQFLFLIKLIPNLWISSHNAVLKLVHFSIVFFHPCDMVDAPGGICVLWMEDWDEVTQFMV